MQPRYLLSESTKEERDNFMMELQVLLDKHSLYFEPIPQITRESNDKPWHISCQILLQKRTLIENINEPTKKD